MKRFGLTNFLGAALAVLGLALATGCSKEPPPREEPTRPIKIHEVEAGPFGQGKEFPGVARASQRAELSFRVAGRLTELLVEEGQEVAAGAVVARLDRRDLESRRLQVVSELDRAQALLTQMKAGARPDDIRRLESALAARRSEAETSQAHLERMATLLAEAAVSQSEYDRAKTQADLAQASLEAVEAELRIARSGARDEEVSAQEAAIRGITAQLADVDNALEDSELRAPFAGIISQKMTENFQDIQARQPIVRLQDLSTLHVLINVTESDMARGAGEGVRLIEEQRVVAYARFPALPALEIPLRAREFQAEADPGTQTFRVTLEMEQGPPYLVKPGMNVVVTSLGMNAERAGAGLHIPISAINSTQSGRTAVWVVDPETGRVAPREVELGEVHLDRIRVLAGLEPGERIAASAVNMLRQGMRVTQLTDPREL